MPRTPDEILTVLDDAQIGLDNLYSGQFDLRSLMWEIIEDVRSSYFEAMSSAVGQGLVRVIERTVDDYLTNHYGDD